MDSLKTLDKSGLLILDLLQNKIPYSNTLSKHIELGSRNGFMQGLLSTDGYEAYKNAGFDIVQSKSIKKEILSLFEVNYERTEKFRLYLLQNAIADVEFFKKYIRDSKPVDDQEFISDNYVYQTFIVARYTRNQFHENLSYSLNETQQVLQLIKEELGETESFD